jgi:hypothetical protein
VRSQPQQAETILGSISNHQVQSISSRDPILIQYHQLSCFCFVCFTYSCDSSSYQSDHVQDWILHRMVPQVPAQVQDLYDSDKEVDAGTGGKWIAEALNVDDNVAVRALRTNDKSFLDHVGRQLSPYYSRSLY